MALVHRRLLDAFLGLSVTEVIVYMKNKWSDRHRRQGGCATTAFDSDYLLGRLPNPKGLYFIGSSIQFAVCLVDLRERVRIV